VCVATVLTVETGKRTTGLLVLAAASGGADTQISIRRYRYPLLLASIGWYPIPVSV